MTVRPTLLVGLALLLAACGAGAGGASVTGGAGGAAVLSCGDATWQEGGLDALPPLDELPEDVLAATDDVDAPVVDRSLPWRVAEQGETDVVLVRRLDPDDPAAADGPTHAALSLFRSGGVSNPPDTWFYASGDLCTPRLAGGNAGEQAEVRLADMPSPEDTALQLLVRERACASGRSADGRIRVDDVTVTDREVRLRVSVVPPGGSQECPDNPWTPFELDLGEALGERDVVDANVVPATPLVVGTAEPAPVVP